MFNSRKASVPPYSQARWIPGAIYTTASAPAPESIPLFPFHTEPGLVPVGDLRHAAAAEKPLTHSPVPVSSARRLCSLRDREDASEELLDAKPMPGDVLSLRPATW
jgi:hypothetical protein